MRAPHHRGAQRPRRAPAGTVSVRDAIRAAVRARPGALSAELIVDVARLRPGTAEQRARVELHVLLERREVVATAAGAGARPNALRYWPADGVGVPACAWCGCPTPAGMVDEDGDPTCAKCIALGARSAS